MIRLNPHFNHRYIFYSPDDEIRSVLEKIELKISEDVRVCNDTVGLEFTPTIVNRDVFRIRDECKVDHRLVVSEIFQ